MPTRTELLTALEASGADLPGGLDDETPLITSGVLDSTALFELALWVEERVSPGLDLTSFDLTAEWNTVAQLLAFIERHAAPR